MTHSNNSLSGRSVNAGIWTVGSRLLSKGIDFGTLLLLARFLGPKEFGLIAIVMTFIVVVETVLEVPIGSALVRVKNLTSGMLNTAFTLALMRGAILGAILAIVSVLIPAFYGDSRLGPLTITLSLAPIMRGLASPAMVFYSREMNFKPQVFLEVAGKFAAFLVAGTMGALTGSYWAIAMGIIVTPTVMTVGSYILKPIIPRLSLEGWPLFRDVVSWNMLSQLIAAVNWQVDKLLLPRFVSTADFGSYSMANDLSTLPYQVLGVPLLQPLNVALNEAERNQHLRESYLKASGLMLLAIAPIFLFGSIMAAQAVAIFLGSRWNGAEGILQGLLVVALLTAPVTPMPTLALTLNQSKRITHRYTIEFAIRLPLMFCFIAFFGIAGAIAAKIVAALAVTIVSMMAVRSMISTTLREQCRVIFYCMVTATPGCVFAILCASYWPAGVNFYILFLLFIAAGVIFLLIYAATVYFIYIILRADEGMAIVIERMLSGSKSVLMMALGKKS